MTGGLGWQVDARVVEEEEGLADELWRAEGFHHVGRARREVKCSEVDAVGRGRKGAKRLCGCAREEGDVIASLIPRGNRAMALSPPPMKCIGARGAGSNSVDQHGDNSFANVPKS